MTNKTLIERLQGNQRIVFNTLIESGVPNASTYWISKKTQRLTRDQTYRALRSLEGKGLAEQNAYHLWKPLPLPPEAG